MAVPAIVGAAATMGTYAAIGATVGIYSSVAYYTATAASLVVGALASGVASSNIGLPRAPQ
jgi:hypothetical protein